jgi:CheY-like chemotaxis protein
VVDDEPDMEALISQRFRKQIKENKFEFVFARNGNEALERLEEHSEIALVLTDINMPGMDGLTLLSKIKEKKIPVQSLVISAYGDLKNIRTAMNQGAFDFLIKPIDFQDFEITLNKTIENVLFVAKSLQNEIQLNQEIAEKLIAQEELLLQLKQNATIISEQNVMLEAKVQERTQELLLKNEIISQERDKSDKLLLNILPFEIAQELKEFGTTQAKHFDEVTVMFTDFKYTAIFGDTQRRNGFISYLSLSIIFISTCIFVRLFNIKKLYFVTIIIGTISMVYAFMQATGNDFVKWNNPYNSVITTLGNPNFAAAVMAIMGVIIFAAVFIDDFNVTIRVFSILLTSLLLLAIYKSNAKQGLLSYFLGIGIFLIIWLWVKNSKLGIISLSTGIFIFIFSVLGMLQIGPFEKFLYKPSVSIRGFYWRAPS